jgi:hypothetical protein
MATGGSEPAAQGSDDGGLPEAQVNAVPREFIETRQSVVVRILVHQGMPESYQAQLLRALERQVNRANPLIGLSDLYPVKGPLDLSGLDRFLVTEADPENVADPQAET